MNFNNRIFLILVVLLSAHWSLWSQSEHPLVKHLVQDGLENVVLIEKDAHFYLAYENNRYRYEGRALAEVLMAAHKYLPQDADKISILIKRENIPMTLVESGRGALEALMIGVMSYDDWTQQALFSFSTDRVSRVFEDHPVENSSFYKVDLPVGVFLDYALGNFENGVRIDLNAQPELHTDLGNGLGLNMGYLVHVEDDLFYNNTSYPFIWRFTQNMRLKENQFLNINMGYFSFARFGLHVRYANYVLEERLSFDMQYGITQTGYLDPELKLNQNSNPLHSFTAGLTYRWNKADTDFSFHYGKFILSDIGYRVSVQRQFDEVFIGLFLVKTSVGDNLGFNFSAPMMGKKYMKPGRVRVRPADRFDLLYRYTAFNGAGLEYSTGENLMFEIKEYYPQILKKAIPLYINTLNL